ncbi:MAG TPA: sigma-70 family RNA polymerase sigma factor [Polyangia bacterium]|nr:sigma-70 family RNA polymerase sigma factor [Polyangia bacterium]
MNAKAVSKEARSDYGRVIDEEFDFVHRTLRRHGVPAADCEDLAQEVFLVTWRRWHDYDQRRPLRAWLTGIAYRVARDYRRSLRRRARPELTPDLPDEAPLPDHELASARTRSLVLRALQTLPESDHQLLVRHELEGRSIRDIARDSSLPLFTVYTRLRRARLRFATAVERLRGDRAPRRALWWWPVPVGAALATAVALVVVAVGRPRPPVGAPGRLPDLPGLVGHWSFDEREGAVARDLSGNGGDCQLHDFDPGGHIAGVRGAALRLMPQGWLSCPQRPLDDRAMSVAAWVRKGRGRKAATTLVTRQQGESRTFSLGFEGDRVYLRSPAWGIELSAPLPAHDRWLHVAFTRSGPVSRLYLDGVEVASRSDGLATPGPAEGELTVGAARFATGPLVRQRLDGAIDELFAFGRALGPGEIAALARR